MDVPTTDPPHGTLPSVQRSYWRRWSKQDIFPEESFRDCSSYKYALSQTCSRLKDRLLDRSSDDNELIELPKASGIGMKKCLTWWDLIWLAFGSVVGSGIFTITGLEARDDAGPSIVISYVVSGLSALLSVFCYSEFAIEVPVAGGSFSFLRIELGDFIAFIAAGNIFLEAIVGAAGLGRSWSSYFASMINSDNPDFLRFKVSFLSEGFNLLDPIAVIVLLVANGIAVSGTRRTSFLTWITSVISTLLIIFVIVIGFVKGNSANLVPFFPFGARGVFRAAAVVYWSYTGFDMVATMAEETKKPSRDIPVGLIGSMSVISVIYCLMALSLTMLQKYTEIDRNAAFSVAFDKIGMTWAKYLVSIVAIKGMTTSLLVGSMGQARYTTQIARAHLIPPLFALVHPKTGTPVYATLLTTITSAIVALFSSLDVLSSVFSFSTLAIFMLMAVALLVRRYYNKDTTPSSDYIKFLICLFSILGSCLALTTVWNLDRQGWIEYVVPASFWFLSTLAMSFLPKYRSPKVWGVPLVPWLPSLSIGMNLILIGSLGTEAFLRFFICSAVMLLYYLFIGLHATYDVAHQDGLGSKNEEIKDDDSRVV
ncbi:cationic amino acid transporter 8, vacuolar [Cucumis sativus]|uniref:Cationic amino acid transporter C-terminal domain-containing protein n=1 Tax=Cucumis sativus TaxID=3659 RepID=A0A0A0KVH5_CUCSA|nr:cationic amino acid transporter 8, vacuolar [Cucumis sativus]